MAVVRAPEDIYVNRVLAYNGPDATTGYPGDLIELDLLRSYGYPDPVSEWPVFGTFVVEIRTIGVLYGLNHAVSGTLPVAVDYFAGLSIDRALEGTLPIDVSYSGSPGIKDQNVTGTFVFNVDYSATFAENKAVAGTLPISVSIPSAAAKVGQTVSGTLAVTAAYSGTATGGTGALGHDFTGANGAAW